MFSDINNRDQRNSRKYQKNETLTSNIYINHKHRTTSRTTSQLPMLSCSSSTNNNARETNPSNNTILSASFLPLSTSSNNLRKVIQINSDSEEESDFTFEKEQTKVVKWFKISNKNGNSLCFDIFDVFEE